MTDGTSSGDSMAHLAAPTLVGQVLDGRYKIVRKLGEGGMGEVYAADHVHIEKRFAIKLLRPEIISNPEAVSRFRQEARSSSSIGHRNIIAIEDFGTTSDGRVYMCMELLNGAALNDLITTPQPVDRLLNILIQTGHGLAAAHAKGIVHRDMKPENVFVTIGPNGEDIPKLLDFGIAKVSGNDGQNNLTRTGTIFGTPFYMAPEQALGNPVDARTDIYAVGVIMYEVFAGSLPFQGESFMGILTQHITTEPESVAARAQKAGRMLPPGLADIITRCMQKNPAQRFSTMDELVNALVNIYRGIAGPGMSTYMEAFPGSPTSSRMAVPTPGPMQAATHPVAATVGVGGPSMTPQGMPQMHPPQSGQGPSVSPSGPYAPPMGQPQIYDPNAGRAPAPFQKKKSNLGLIIAIALVVLGGAGAAVYFLVIAPGDGPSGGGGSGSQVAGGDPDKKIDAGGGTVDPPTVDAGGGVGVDPPKTIDAGEATVTVDAGETLVPPPTIDAGVAVRPDDIEVQVFLKNGGRFDVYEDGTKIMEGPDKIMIHPGASRTVVIKAVGFKDKLVTIDDRKKKLEVKLDRAPVLPTGCTATSCPAGQACESGKCKKVLVPPPGCTANSCPSGERCDSGKCRKIQVTPPGVDCTNAIVDVKSGKCKAQFCRAHPDDLKCGVE
ncbi:MAG: protein kinase [Kofleriaceae bacterium]